MSDSTIEDQFVPIDLPSKLKPYTATEFYIRPLKVAEVKKIRPVVQRNDMGALLDLIKPCVRPIAPEDLTTGDLWYILAWIRLNTFPHIDMHLPWKCSECGSNQMTRLDLGSIDVVELPEEYTEPAWVPLSDDKFVPLQNRRAGAYKKAHEWLKTFLGKEPTHDEVSEVELAMTIATEEEFGSLHKKQEFLDGVSAEDYLVIEDFQLAYAHGLPNEVTDSCKECGHENSHVRVVFRPTDLVPVGRSQNNIRNTVQFGKAPSRSE